MEPQSYTARRATLDDVPALQSLWQDAGLPWEELEKFFSEFQVIPGEEGVLLGAIGMMVENNYALLHSEALRSDDDEFRAALWRRIEIVARNQGLHGIWTQEDSPYWQASGFDAAKAAEINSTAASFLDPSASWWVFRLVDPSKAESVVQEQMAVWQATRAQEAEEFQNKVKVFRGIALVAALVVFLLIVGFLIVAMKTGMFNGRVR